MQTLVSSVWLKEHLDDPNLVVLDTRPKVACMHGHRASALFYQLKVAGFERVRLYDGSFIGWHSKRLALE